MLRFPSKIDLWLGALLSILVLGEGIGGLLLVVLGPERIVGGILLAAATFVAWVTFTTLYEMDDEKLLVRAGPFCWRVPIAEIEAIVPTCNPLSSPALSLDRLRIEYRLGEKRRSIMISPREKGAFLQAIVQRNVRLRLNGDRVERADAR